MLIFDSPNPYPGPLKTTGLLRRLYICCSECWLETRWRALAPPRSLVSTRLVVIVMSILKERVWEGNLFIFENCPHSPASRGSARVPLTDRILPSVWLDHPTGLDDLGWWHDFKYVGVTCIIIFSAVIATLFESRLSNQIPADWKRTAETDVQSTWRGASGLEKWSKCCGGGGRLY